VFFCSIEAYSITAQKALDAALANLTKEDPSLRVEVHPDTGQTVLSGMGELHLDIIQSRLKVEYGLEVELGPLEIAYREAPTEEASATETINQNIGGKNQFAEIELTVTPAPEGTTFTGVTFHSTDDDEHQALVELKPFMKKAISRGVKSALSSGPLLRCPVVDTSVCVHKFSKKFSTSVPVMTAVAAAATSRALKAAGCSLLEPVMHLEVSASEDRADRVMTDLADRRSHILAVHARTHARIIEAHTPLQTLVGYSTALRTMTSGGGSCCIQLSHYQRMSQADMQGVMDRKAGFCY